MTVRDHEPNDPTLDVLQGSQPTEAEIAEDLAWADDLFARTPVTDDVQALVGTALAREAARTRWQLVAASAGALTVAVLGGLAVAPSIGEIFAGLSAGTHLAIDLAKVVMLIVPGAWSTVAVAAALGALLVGGWVLRAVPPVAEEAVTRPSVATAAAWLLVLGTALAPTAQAQPEVAAPEVAALTLEGDWPVAGDGEPVEPVSVSFDDTPLPDALREALAAHELQLLFSSRLPRGEPLPRVTAHFEGAALTTVLSALAEASAPARLVARRRDDAVVVRLVGPATTPEAPGGGAAADPAFGLGPGETAPDFSSAPDRFTMGDDITIAEGERVKDVFTLGGDVRVLGEAHDVFTLGGDIVVGPNGRVYGDLVTTGGEVTVEEGGRTASRHAIFSGGPDDPTRRDDGGCFGPFCPDGDDGVDADAGWSGWGFLGFVGEAIAAAAQGALVFLLGLIFIGVAPSRFQRLQATIAGNPLRAGAVGLGACVAAALASVVLLVTIIGIPIAFLLVVSVWLLGYVGASVAASVLGAALPFEGLQGRPLAQLAVGVAVLVGVSLVPVAGTFVIIGAIATGIGAFVVTRFGATTPVDLG